MPISQPRRDEESPLRVLFVTPRYAPYVGGVEQAVYEVARRLAAGGCRVRVLTTDPTGNLPASEDTAGVSIRRVRAWPRGRDYYFAPGIYREIMAGRDDWDILHVQSYHTFVAPLAMLASRRARLPYVLTFHGGGHSSRLRRQLRRVQRLLLGPLVRGAETLVAVAQFEVALYGDMFRVPATQFEVISNGLDLPRRLPPSRPTGALIASIGRLERYKGHQRILAALPSILAVRPDARLWIAGEGPYGPALRRQAASLGVSDRVEIRAIPTGAREQMAAEISKSALVVLLSEYETQPLSILEAVALGRPALVADTSGLTELAERGLAVAIPLDSSPGEVASEVLNQLESPTLPRPESLPTWDDCAGSLLRLYTGLVGRPSRER